MLARAPQRAKELFLSAKAVNGMVLGKQLDCAEGGDYAAGMKADD